ncbi:TPA: hypothetical protein OUF25_005044 [Enterobacter hormaechei]|nr:hypothetical protein [Enterobacter hormaechei]
MTAIIFINAFGICHAKKSDDDIYKVFADGEIYCTPSTIIRAAEDCDRRKICKKMGHRPFFLPVLQTD